MKACYFLLVFFVNQAFSEQSYSSISPQSVRLAIGFYSPSLNNVTNHTDIQISLNYWMKELTNKINVNNSYSILFSDITEMAKAFHTQKIDMIIAPPMLVAIHFDRSLLANGFMAVQHTNKIDQLVIIANRENAQTPINYLGKHLILPKNDLMAEMFLAAEILEQHKQPYHQVFSHVSLNKKTQRIILDLFFNKADIAVVYKSTIELMAEMNPQITKKIHILKKFPTRAINYGYFHKDYNYQHELRKRTKQFGSELRGRQILDIFQTADLAICFVEYLKPYDVFYQHYLSLKSTPTND